MTARPAPSMSQDELFKLPVTVDLATAGRAFGLGPTTSRKMASEGEFPCRVLRLGHKYRVNRAEILRGLGYEVEHAPAVPAPAT